ncbi:hypothetical protein [Acinetobacter larvae]|uniref:Uncharacterized protein n=1 Tax=Acinetobacter larvae TaxID=1789224 RepID=A0A1B2M063_9GAMM|nr:hypothetical protein [Acinetobacter larvae]AOA58559.1 hypothetical protein BFG52_09475 [Acinetobacter larvae]
MQIIRNSLGVWRDLGFKQVVLLSVLDGRSNLVCACLDGTRFSIQEAQILTTIHHDCRCCFVGIHHDCLPGTRAFVMDTKAAKNIEMKYRQQKIGQVDANITFIEWFDSCTTRFQLEYLGAFRFNLFKNHNYKLTDFVDLRTFKILNNEEIIRP